MKLFLLTATALITGTLMAACGPKDTNKPELIGPEPLTLEEIIAEPYDADTATYDETTGERLDDHQGHSH